MKNATVYIAAAAVLFMFTFAVQAQESYKDFHKYFISVKGWDAEDAEGMELNMPGMQLITSFRNYTQGDKEIVAYVMIGSNQAMAMQRAKISLESTDFSMKTKEINGFQVTHTYDKSDQSALVHVVLGKSEAKSASLMFIGESVGKGETMALAEKFDWKKIAKAAKAKL